MAIQTVKLPQKGAVAKITEERKRLRRQPVSPNLRDVFKKDKGITPEVQDKKIASKPSKREPDMDL